ncbi:MAG: GNAT family N-acetyltransferase [Chthoniobacterales bacterium]|nr:MAG: GNAT family N-acetyltransferase [Chthoniobacterales bacterium]
MSTFSFPGGTATILQRNDLAASGEWSRAFRSQCKDHRYYEIIEQTLANDFQYQYLLLRDTAGAVRGIQPFFFVQQNLVEGIPGGFRQMAEKVRRAFPRFLTMRMLMVGCAAGEGHMGNFASADLPWLADALHAVLPAIARGGKASLIALKDFSSKYRDVLGCFSSNGYARVPSMPMTRLALNYRDFDDYLAGLGYATRKSLRRKFRKIDRAAEITREITSDITPYIDEVYPLYLAVHERSPMKFETLTKEYLRQVGREMPERTRYFIWRIEGCIVAFSLCFVHDGTIYDEYLGLDYSVALDLHLYFHTIRDILSWAIENGLTFYCSSPLNYDPKLHLGFELAPLDLYVRHSRAVLNPIFGRVVKWLEPTRHDAVLRRFPNAAELWG